MRSNRWERRRSEIAIVCFAGCILTSRAAGQEARPDPVALELVGTLSPARLVKLESSIPGRVVKVHVEVGDRVRAGDLLVELDDGRYRSELELAQTDLELVKARYREVSEVVAAKGKDQSPGKERLAVAKDEVKRAEESLSAARHRFDQTKVRAPIAGTILKRTVGMGDAVNPSDPGSPSLFELADLSKLIAIMSVPESRSGRVHRGQEAKIRVAALPKVVLEGKVVRIDPKIDPGTRCFATHVEIKSSGHGSQLKPGMSAQVSLLEKK